LGKEKNVTRRGLKTLGDLFLYFKEGSKEHARKDCCSLHYDTRTLHPIQEYPLKGAEDEDYMERQISMGRL